MNMSANDWRGEHLIRRQNPKPDDLAEPVVTLTRHESLKRDSEAIRAIASNMSRSEIKNHLGMTTHRVDYVLRMFPDIVVIEHRYSPKQRKS